MVDQIKKIIGTGGEESFVKRSVFSSEFLFILIYVAGVYANGAFDLGVSETSMMRIETLVLTWTGIRQVGKAVSYRNSGKGDT